MLSGGVEQKATIIVISETFGFTEKFNGGRWVAHFPFPPVVKICNQIFLNHFLIWRPYKHLLCEAYFL